MTSPDVLGLTKLKQGTGNVLWLHNSGTRCVFGVPPGLQNAMTRLRPIPVVAHVYDVFMMCL